MRAAGLLCVTLSTFACSKTQDTAPERRIFGSPPSIQSVDVVDIPASPAVCDWTEMAKQMMTCDFGLDPAFLPDPFPTITVSVTYNEVVFNVRATDPESTPSQTDILLVTASYVTNVGNPPQEISLIILDDGGTNRFEFLQKADFYGEACTPLDTSVCNDAVCNADLDFNGQPDLPRTESCCCTFCTQKTYSLDSNDMTMGDGLYTRGFAFKLLSGGGVPAGARAEGLLVDCMVSQKKQAPAESTNLVGAPIAFKIEAIDRSGNIATWPQKPEVSIQPSTLTCSGDECACCILTNSNVSANCRRKPGLVGQLGSGYEGGLCFLF